MKKEIFSWAALENCHYNTQKLRESILCCRCGNRIQEAGFWGYTRMTDSRIKHQSRADEKETLLIRRYQFLHIACDIETA